MSVLASVEPPLPAFWLHYRHQSMASQHPIKIKLHSNSDADRVSTAVICFPHSGSAVANLLVSWWWFSSFLFLLSGFLPCLGQNGYKKTTQSGGLCASLLVRDSWKKIWIRITPLVLFSCERVEVGGYLRICLPGVLLHPQKNLFGGFLTQNIFPRSVHHLTP